MAKDYGDNLGWFLHDVSCADADQIDSNTIDIYGETESGADTSCEVDLRELCGAAHARIKELELDLGLMTIARDQQRELRKSCEQALEQRDSGWNQ